MALSYPTLPDDALLELMQADDERAYLELYLRYRGVLYGYASRIIGENDQAEDLVQDVFMAFWDHRKTLKISASLAAYLYSAVRYRFFDWVDKQRVRQDYVSGFDQWLERGTAPADSKLLTEELLVLVEETVAKLPYNMRRVFELSYKQELSHQEIAELTGLSNKTIRNNLSGALRALRKRLGPYRFSLLFAC
jgi:RNA polymerase sigma-70 factor, ECF subfamily